jgi:hypothetical protein
MQRLEVSGAVRLIYKSLGVKGLIAGYTLAVWLCTMYAERHFTFFPSFQLQKTWCSLFNTTVLQQHSVGTSDQGLSLYRSWSVTRHQTSGIKLQELPVQWEAVKTLAVHCHCDVSSAAGGHSAGCRTSWVCLQHHAMWWHLMVLQYVAASFHLPSVSTANINTVQ